MLIKYIKSVLWKVAKRLSYIQDARCLKVTCRNRQHPRKSCQSYVQPGRDEKIEHNEYRDTQSYRFIVLLHCKIKSLQAARPCLRLLFPRQFTIYSVKCHLLRKFIVRCKHVSRYLVIGRSHWPRGLRRGSAAARLLGLWIRIPSGTWTPVCCEWCMLSSIGLCAGPITHLEESHLLWCV